MAPPKARRYASLKKPPRKLDPNASTADMQRKERKNKLKSAAASKPPPIVTANNIIPGVDTAFKTLVSARMCSAIWTYISDCDETFNYWEPLHYIINGHGLQTWEYSPKYALRSYTYLLLQGVPGWIYQKVFNPSPVLLFYLVRCILGFGCAVMERYMYKSICQEFGVHIGRLWLIFQLFSVGMFVSSTALLPSSFSMYFGCAALSAWWQQRYSLAIFLTAISAFLGWPFAALIGAPIAIDMLLRKRYWKTFLIWCAISTVTIAVPMTIIDSTYYGRLIFAPLNLVMYNVFTSHGPNIFGVEPLSYYLVNGFLNFNIIWPLALVTPAMLIIDYFVVPAKSRATLNFPHYLSLLPFYLWLLVFFMQPHKEERFLFPVYPLISLCGAITVDVLQRMAYRIKTLLKTKPSTHGSHYLDHSMAIAVVAIIISTVLGLSRVFSLYRNYHAPMDVLMELNVFKNSPEYTDSHIYNVCVGKDWYRYPSSFFLPADNFRLRFLKSEFKGMLPVYYADGENATQIVHSYFNDMNKEDEHTYFNYENCHFLIDLDEGKYTQLEPSYAKRTKDWTIMKSLPFLIQEKSHKLFRAFYVPILSEKYTTHGEFYLLKRKQFKTS